MIPCVEFSPSTMPFDHQRPKDLDRFDERFDQLQEAIIQFGDFVHKVREPYLPFLNNPKLFPKGSRLLGTFGQEQSHADLFTEHLFDHAKDAMAAKRSTQEIRDSIKLEASELIELLRKEG